MREREFVEHGTKWFKSSLPFYSIKATKKTAIDVEHIIENT